MRCVEWPLEIVLDSCSLRAPGWAHRSIAVSVQLLPLL